MNQRGKAFHHDLGVQYGSKVALFMYNRPEFISNWYGAINCGATPAFINNNLRKLSNNSQFDSLKKVRHKNFSKNWVIWHRWADFVSRVKLKCR